jgi:hypothetical protein
MKINGQERISDHEKRKKGLSIYLVEITIVS